MYLITNGNESNINEQFLKILTGMQAKSIILQEIVLHCIIPMSHLNNHLTLAEELMALRGGRCWMMLLR